MYQVDKVLTSVANFYIQSLSFIIINIIIFQLLTQSAMVFSVIHTQEVLDQLWVRHKWFRVCVYGISTVLNLSQCFKIAHQDIAQPLSIYTWNLPLFGFFIFKPNWSEKRQQHACISYTVILHKPISFSSTDV